MPSVELIVTASGSFGVVIEGVSYHGKIDRDEDTVKWTKEPTGRSARLVVEEAAGWLVGLMPRVKKGDSMSTTKEDIRRWLDIGRRRESTHMLVVLDKFDYDDFPIYVQPGESVLERFDEYAKSSMEKVMEVYSFSLPIDAQLAEQRAWHP